MEPQYSIPSASPLTPRRSSSSLPSRFGQSDSPRLRQHSSYSRQKVLLVGNSHFANPSIAISRIVPRADVSILPAYTIPEAAAVLADLDFSPDCLVLHLITNDVKQAPPQTCVAVLNDLIAKFTANHPHAKVIVSLGLPRSDDIRLDSSIEIVNTLIKGSIRFANCPRVIFCDHGNFMHNGSVKPRLLAKGGYHLSEDGTRLLCSNIRYKIEIALGMDFKRTKKNT
jgi:hypothetical protein